MELSFDLKLISIIYSYIVFLNYLIIHYEFKGYMSMYVVVQFIVFILNIYINTLFNEE